MRKLITIGISHYCEKSRWALDKAGLPFEEVACAPGAHVWYVKRAGGNRSTPVLVDGGTVVSDSTDIFDHIQAHPDARWRPWPDGADGDEARALEARFDDHLGPHTRRYAYFHLLQDKALVVRFVGSKTSARQAGLFSALFPVMSRLMKRSMKIDAAGAERSLAKIEASFAEVEALLADGRRYLVGDRLSAADVTFATLGGAAVLHPKYLPVDVDTLPPALADKVRAWRERPAGQFVWRLFETER